MPPLGMTGFTVITMPPGTMEVDVALFRENEVGPRAADGLMLIFCWRITFPVSATPEGVLVDPCDVTSALLNLKFASDVNVAPAAYSW